MSVRTLFAVVPALFAFGALACGATAGPPRTSPPEGVTGPTGIEASATQGEHEVALLAGGCFWCLESAFDDKPGIIEAVSGYAGGASTHPAYKEVGHGGTGHAEVVRVVYDPKVLSYDDVLSMFWHNIDPLDGGGQFCDRGDQYRPAVFPLDAAQKAAAQTSATKVGEQLGKKVEAKIEPAATFWRAEEYHQDFHLKQPAHYLRYRLGCGRDARLKDIWGDAAGR